MSCIDTGIGIKEKEQRKLFQMFGYLQDTKQMNIHGIGLGLNISKKIVEQFEGSIEVTSVFNDRRRIYVLSATETLWRRIVAL